MSQRLIKRVIHINGTDVTIARPTNVVGVNTMSQDAFIHHPADGRRTHQEAVLVEMNRRIVAIVVKTELRRVTLGQEILDIHIADIHLLIPRVKSVQIAVGILLEHIKISEVVTDAVVAQVSEETHSWLRIREDESAKIAVELLNAGPNGNKIEIRAEIVQLRLDKTFLQPNMSIEAIDSLSHVNVDQSALTSLQEVQIDSRSKANTKI